MPRFLLDKWYLDVIDARGRAAVGYATELRWGAIALRHAHLLTMDEGGAVRTRTTLRGVTQPRMDARVLSWSLPALHVTSMHRSLAPEVAATLLSSAEGEVRWSCLAPRAESVWRVGDDVFEGLGYAERLRVTLAPWKLPIDELRWGRALARDTGIVWIDWRGKTHARVLVAVDGVVVDGASVDDDGVVIGERRRVSFGDARTLRSGTLATSVLRTLPASVRSRLPGRILALDEHKWTGRATIDGEAASAIWEVVRWP